jgi:hypothetical protein
LDALLRPWAGFLFFVVIRVSLSLSSQAFLRSTPFYIAATCLGVASVPCIYTRRKRLAFKRRMISTPPLCL